jgi:2-oxoglutarate ferredoxin oxidoreductase subunit delta
MNTEQQAPPLALDISLCKACGICIELCPQHVFDETDMGEPVLARPDDCTLCLLCELHCPDFAIEVRRREKKAEQEADESAEAHAERVYAALKASKKAPAEGPDDEACAHRHEEN